MIVKIDQNSPLPKYQQIIQSIIEAIDNNTLVKGDKIPSLNKLVKRYGLSQDTVLTAYNELKLRGIITSQVGKGYYIDIEEVPQKHNVFIMLDKLTAYKEVLYESFKNEIGDKGKVTLCFHYNNPDVFKTLLEDSLNKYTAHVIVPILDQTTSHLLDLIPKNRLYLLDHGKGFFENKYNYVFQDFQEDLYGVLKSNIKLILKYKSWNLVLHQNKFNYLEIKKGFERLSLEFGAIANVISEINEESIDSLKSLFIIIDDKDLVKLVEIANEHELSLGEDMGIISYNETPLKRIVAGGITTISTDFEEMGKKMAYLLINKKRGKFLNPCNLHIRKSI